MTDSTVAVRVRWSAHSHEVSEDTVWQEFFLHARFMQVSRSLVRMAKHKDFARVNPGKYSPDDSRDVGKKHLDVNTERPSFFIIIIIIIIFLLTSISRAYNVNNGIGTWQNKGTCVR